MNCGEILLINIGLSAALVPRTGRIGQRVRTPYVLSGSPCRAARTRPAHGYALDCIASPKENDRQRRIVHRWLDLMALPKKAYHACQSRAQEQQRSGLGNRGNERLDVPERPFPGSIPWNEEGRRAVEVRFP